MGDKYDDAFKVANSLYSAEGMEWLLNSCLKTLLNNKSLYQSVRAGDDLFTKVFLADCAYTDDVDFTGEILRHLKYWAGKTKSIVYRDSYDYTAGEASYQIMVPKTVKTYCNLCKSVTTHNPTRFGECYSMANKNIYTQVFHAEYECQDCKQAEVSFLVMRDGIKFQLMGRSPIEVADVSKEVASQLNDEEVKLFGEAMMASKTGSELAAICLLRVALESYLRRITGNKDTDKMVSGEELYEQYKKKLPSDFAVDRVTSLGKVYNDLSAVMHTAKVPDGCFQDNYQKIEWFFKFLALMPLEN